MSGYFDEGMGQWYPSEPVEVEECAYCGAELYEGEEVLKYDGEFYCDEHCLMSHAMKKIDWSKVTLTKQGGN